MEKEAEQDAYIPDLPDPESPFFILRRSDTVFGSGSTSVSIKSGQVEAGPPIIVPWEPESYGKPTDVPDDMIEMTSVSLVFQSAGVEGAGALVSMSFYNELNSLVPGACKTLDAVLVGPDDVKLEYVVMLPEKRLESKNIDDAKPGDLQWSGLAFNEKDAPGELFVLTMGDMAYIVISKKVAEKLSIEKFRNVTLSAFHRTSDEGGARPAIAAIQRVLNKQGQPGDIELVQRSMQDSRDKSGDQK